MKHIFLFFAFVTYFSTLSSQEILPRGFAKGEEAKMSEYINYVLSESQVRGITTPPEGPIRTMAEWEELDALAITWTGFQGILAEIVRHAKEEVEVVIICSNENAVRNYLSNQSIDPNTNITYLEAPFNSIWIRDYGPNSVYKNDVDSLLLIDWIYNRPRFLDNDVPDVIGNALGVPVYSNREVPNDLVNTGGNFMSDGMNNSFSSNLVLDENGLDNDWGISNHSEEDIDNIMHAYMGVEEYIKMTVLPYDAIHHIDMHMKLLDEETLLIGEYPEGVADGPQIEANIAYIQDNFLTPYGNEYDIKRIPMPPDAFNDYPDENGDYRTYANSIIINKLILIPTYELEFDTTAFRIWEELMPGYNIQGINCNSIIPLSGALHCITKEIGSQEPLLIQHAKYRDVYADLPDGYELNATIRHREGIQSAQVHYRVNAGDYISVDMTQDQNNDFLWSANIPSQETESTIDYYIQAEAVNGKQQVRPMPAPEGFWSFEVEIPVSTSEISKAEVGQVYPNPASSITVIPILSEKTQKANVFLKDITGKLVSTIYSGELVSGQNEVFLMAQNHPPGHYFIEVVLQGEIQTKKLAIK